MNPDVFSHGVHSPPEDGKNRNRKEETPMKEEEKKPIPWEAADPKPPVIRSGRMEDRRNNNNVM